MLTISASSCNLFYYCMGLLQHMVHQKINFLSRYSLHNFFVITAMTYKHLLYLPVLLLFSLCDLPAYAQSNRDYTRLVDPFIGTGGHGHTFPGATAPFGMVQLSPDTRLTGWDGCSGYHYSDTVVYGFSHTHLSGTGIADYNDILFMPTTGEPQFKNTDYQSPFKKKNEMATPG